MASRARGRRSRLWLWVSEYGQEKRHFFCVKCFFNIDCPSYRFYIRPVCCPSSVCIHKTSCNWRVNKNTDGADDDARSDREANEKQNRNFFIWKMNLIRESAGANGQEKESVESCHVLLAPVADVQRRIDVDAWTNQQGQKVHGNEWTQQSIKTNFKNFKWQSNHMCVAASCGRRNHHRIIDIWWGSIRSASLPLSCWRPSRAKQREMHEKKIHTHASARSSAPTARRAESTGNKVAAAIDNNRKIDWNRN